MFAINPSTNDQDNADDPFIFTAGPDLDFANGLKGSQLETLPFSHFETGIYESYDESGPSSVQFADSNDFSERGGSHMSSKDEANGRSPANLDVMGANIKPTAEDHAGDDDPMFIDNVETSEPQLQIKTENVNGAANAALSSSMIADSIMHDTHTSPDYNQPQDTPTEHTPLKQSSGRKDQTSHYRARSSIPDELSWPEFGRQCVLAAYSSRLNPYALHSGEYTLLREHVTHAQVTVYLNIRNAILRLWTRSPLVPVAPKEAAGCARDSRYFNLALVAYEWLVRNGYINFGCLEMPSTAGPIPRVKSKGGRKRNIVVIGAGVSGLGCARQLEGLIAQLGRQWTDRGERPPKVTVIEGRNRIGGRVYSHPLRNQKSNRIPSGLRCTAEMGAQIVTGFEHGNPLNILIRGQLGLHYHRLRDNTILYDHDGSPVDRTRDMKVEKLYNDILERASVYRNKPVQNRTAEGDRALIEIGQEPIRDTGEMISALENTEGSVTVMGTNSAQRENGQKTMPGTEKLPGRAYLLPSGGGYTVSAADAARNMGWELRNNEAKGKSIDLSSIASGELNEFPTLGQAMDAAFEQYQEILDLTPQDMRLLNWHHANLEYGNAANVGLLSLTGWDQDIGNEFEGEHTEIIGGYQQLPRGLWQCPTKLDVRFKSVVKRIRYNARESDDMKFAKIDLVNGEIIDADRVIVTTPLGVLKEGTVKFEPELPDWKLGAIDRLGFGLLNKVVLVYEKPFWEEHRDMFGLLNDATTADSLNPKDYSERRGRFYIFWNLLSTSGRPTLTALMVGDAAYAAEEADNQSLIQEVTGRLSKMFAPQLVPPPEEAIITRWKKDPFTRGSYSYVGAKAKTGDYDTMAKSVEPLHFAGEATCGTHPATVHGAYLSGLRAASDVVNSLLGPIQIPQPLVPPKVKVETAPPTPAVKHKVEKGHTPDTDTRKLKQAIDESYEASIIGAILAQIGERPVKPGASGVNPFLLYTKDMWYKCKALTEEAKKKATGNPNAKAERTEIRIALGKMWRDAPNEVKEPYLAQTQLARDIGSANMTEFKERVVVWDREAARIRKEYVENNPRPDIDNFDGRTAIEMGGSGRRNRRL